MCIVQQSEAEQCRLAPGDTMEWNVSNRLVAGVDSSTQSCKIMIRDADTGALVRSGMAYHRTGTTVNPAVWIRAFEEAVHQAGGLDDISAISVAGQQHGLVPLDESGRVVRDAVLWNDTSAGADAQDLIMDLGAGNETLGRKKWIEKTGSVPVSSLTVSKLRHLAVQEPENLARTSAIALPHDYLTWKITGSSEIADLVTDRSDASGTGYFDPVSNVYLPVILELAAGKQATNLVLPKVLGPNTPLGEFKVQGREMLVGPGSGDNAGAALGLDQKPGHVIISLGTSGVVSLVSEVPINDEVGEITGFADATGKYLPLVCTLNASRVLDTTAAALGVNYERFSEFALSAPPGAEGLVMIPYFTGERTPNIPLATGSLLGIRGNNLTASNIARAAVEGMLCLVGYGLEIFKRLGVVVNGVSLIGGGAKSEAVRRIAPSVLGVQVTIPETGEYVADGAARQAAWVLSGEANPPEWAPRLNSSYTAQAQPFIMGRYQEINDRYVETTQLGLE